MKTLTPKYEALFVVTLLSLASALIFLAHNVKDQGILSFQLPGFTQTRASTL